MLGAGPAGLGAAYRAAKRGFSVTVLERAERVGGAAGSFDVGGMRVDFGSHRLHPSVDPRILRDLQRLLGDDLQKRERRGRIRLMGRWISFPLKAKELGVRMPKGFVAAAARDALVAPLRKPHADTFAEILRAGLGPAICERFYFPYARKIWGVEPEELSGEQARRRVTADSPGKLLARLLRGSGSGGARGSAHFWYPKRGYGQLSEVLAEAAAAAGADIRLGHAAGSIEQQAESVTVTSGSASLEARRVFSTIPLTVLAKLLGPPAHVAEAASALRFRAMTLVYLVLDKERFTSFDAHYLPEAFTPVTRISEPKNYRAGDDPQARTVLCAEIPCDRGDAVRELDDAGLQRVVVDAIDAAGLPRVEPVAVHVERLPFAYPIYELGSERHFATIDEWVGTYEHLLTFGRQGLFAHDNAHHALAMAYSAVDRLLADGGFDRDGWRSDRRVFESHVVED